MEELFEIWTWAQLGMHNKPCVLLNVADYYNQLIGFLDQMTQAGYLKESSRLMLSIASNPLEAISLCLSGS